MKRRPIDPLTARAIEDLTRAILSAGTPLVLYVPDLAAALRVSVSQITTLLRHDPHALPPELPALDAKHRWALPTVVVWMLTDSRVRGSKERAA